MGLEFKENLFIIKDNNEREVQANQVYNVQVAVDGLTSAKTKQKYSIMLADQVVVGEKGA